MTFLLDDRARDAIARRMAAGKPVGIDVHVVPVFHGGATLSVDWACPCGEDNCTSDHGDDVTLYVDPQIARFARWQDVVISAERLGPFEQLTLQDPLALLNVRHWERTHPAHAH